MSGAIHPLPQYAFMVWCSVKAQGQLYLYNDRINRANKMFERSEKSVNKTCHNKERKLIKRSTYNINRTYFKN
jgi:hypothetical protein